METGLTEKQYAELERIAGILGQSVYEYVQEAVALKFDADLGLLEERVRLQRELADLEVKREEAYQELHEERQVRKAATRTPKQSELEAGAKEIFVLLSVDPDTGEPKDLEEAKRRYWESDNRAWLHSRLVRVVDNLDELMGAPPTEVAR